MKTATETFGFHIALSTWISHSFINLDKGINPAILPPSMGQIVGQSYPFSLGMATSLEHFLKFKFQSIKLRLKIGFPWHPARAEKLGKYVYKFVRTLIYIYIYIYTPTHTHIYIYIYIYIYTPLPTWGWVLWRRSNRVAISAHCKPLRRWIEVSATVERMYVNNSNCDS